MLLSTIRQLLSILNMLPFTSNSRLLSTIDILLGSLLDPILHSIKVGELVRILTQTPSHNTTDFLSLHNVGELLGDQLGGVPGPEEVSLLVPVVLAASFLIGLPVLFGAAPGVSDRDALAGAIVREAASLAEVVTGAAECC